LFVLIILTVVTSFCSATWLDDPPHSRDLSARRLEEIGDADRSAVHRLSIARRVVCADDIFSSSNVINAFWKRKRKRIFFGRVGKAHKMDTDTTDI
jgi:hypothetical protein